MSEQIGGNVEDGSGVPGWIGARSAWGLLAGSVACLSLVLVFGNSMSGAVETVLIGLMMGLGLIAAAAGFVWFRSARLMSDPSGQRFGAGVTMVGGLLVFALPLLIFLYVMFIYEGY